MPTVTGTQILDQLLDEVPQPSLGYKFAGTATAAGAVVTTTDPQINALGANGEAQRFGGRLLYIPSASGADQVHSITDISVSANTTTITTLGTYGSTYTSVAMYILADHPDSIRNLINDALEQEYTDAYVPLAHGPDDYDMQAANTTSWPDSSNVTVTLNTTAPEVFMGVRGKKTAFSDAGYSENTGFVRVRRDERVLFWGIWKADVGTITLQLVSRAGTVLDSIDNTSEAWMLGYKTVAIPSGVEEVTLRLAGSANGDEGDWSAACITRLDNRRFNLPSWADTRGKLRGLAKLNHLGRGYDNYTYEAMDFEELVLTEGDEYRYLSREGDINPYQVVLTQQSTWGGLLSHPLFLVGQRPFSDYGTLTTDASTTTVPMRNIVTRAKYLLGERFPSTWPGLKEQMAPQLSVLSTLRMTRRPKPAKHSWGMFR